MSSSNFVFCFLFLFSNLPLLLSAAPECEKGITLCGYLGEISFPFTTVNDSECGYYISGCDNSSLVKTIQLRDQTYIIDSMYYMNNSIIIYSPNSHKLNLESAENTKIFSINTVSFYKCNHSPEVEDIVKYRNCSDYDIYFTSIPDYSPMFPIFPFPCLPIVPYHCEELLFSLLEIKIDLEFLKNEVDSKLCDKCYRKGGLCLPDQKTLKWNTLKLNCVRGSNIHTKRKEQHLKLAVIGTVFFPYHQTFILVRT